MNWGLVLRYILTIVIALGIMAFSVGFIMLKAWGIQFLKNKKRK
jgi:hypothetical protein